MNTLQNILSQSSFDQKKAEIYLILAQNGKLSVPQILKKTTLSRTTVYDMLTELLAEGYVEYAKVGRDVYYSPAHPSQLHHLIEQKKQEVKLFEDDMKEVIKELTGAYNLNLHKPGVRFFEGEDGHREALFDTLTASTEILAYINFQTIETHTNHIDEEYFQERLKRKKSKRLLLTHTEENKKFLFSHQNEYSTTRLLPKNLKAFDANIQIYDDKIAFFSVREDNLVAIIIEDAQLAAVHRNIFEYLWGQSSTHLTETQSSSRSNT